MSVILLVLSRALSFLFIAFTFEYPIIPTPDVMFESFISIRLFSEKRFDYY